MDTKQLTDAEIRSTMMSEQILLERKLTCEAINGAMAFGYQNTNAPPSDDHWLAPFWKVGRQQAELEAKAALPSDAMGAPVAWMSAGFPDGFTKRADVAERWRREDGSVIALYAAPVAPDTPSDELASMTRMFHAACADLGAINEALGLNPDDGGAEPILDAIAELKRERDQWIDANYVAAAAPQAPVADAERAEPILTCATAMAAIDDFEIVGENNDSREPTDEDRFILSEFIAHCFGGCRVATAQQPVRASKAGEAPTDDRITENADAESRMAGYGVDDGIGIPGAHWWTFDRDGLLKFVRALLAERAAAPAQQAVTLTDVQIEQFATEARQHEAMEFSGCTKVASHDNVIWAIRRALAAQQAVTLTDAAPLFANDAERSEFVRAMQEFEDCNETGVDYRLLVKWAASGLLECNSFLVTENGAQTFAALQSHPEGGQR